MVSSTQLNAAFPADQHCKETAVAAYWVTDGVLDRCQAEFLPRHCVFQVHVYDGHLVQVVAMLAQSENASERKLSRYNRGACHASITDTKITKVVSMWNECTWCTVSVHGLLAPLIVAGGCLGSDAEDDKFTEYIDDDLLEVKGKEEED
jgi:hypothetical protein